MLLYFVSSKIDRQSQVQPFLLCKHWCSLWLISTFWCRHESWVIFPNLNCVQRIPVGMWPSSMLWPWPSQHSLCCLSIMKMLGRSAGDLSYSVLPGYSQNVLGPLSFFGISNTWVTFIFRFQSDTNMSARIFLLTFCLVLLCSRVVLMHLSHSLVCTLYEDQVSIQFGTKKKQKHECWSLCSSTNRAITVRWSHRSCNLVFVFMILCAALLQHTHTPVNSV